MPTKKLIHVGNSSALVLDKPTLQQLGVGENGEVHLTLTGNSLVITGAQGSSIPKDKFERIAKEVVKEHLPLLRRLAKR